MTTKAPRLYHSGLTGAPTLSGTAGAMIALLDACLINGWGSGTVDSVTVSSNVATVTRAAGHPFSELDLVVEIAGATGSFTGLNGTHEVLSFTATTYTFACPGVGNGTATGTITHKLAPLGWAKQYSGTNLAAYKPADVTATGNLLRVDDTGTTNARVVGYETMTDVNTGAGPFPTAAQMSGGLYWAKSISADSTVRSWTLIGDSRAFYLSVSYGSFSLLVYFGDVVSRKTPDPYACGINGSISVPANGVNSSTFDNSATSGSAAMTMPRSYSGIGTAVQAIRTHTLRFGDGGYSGISGLDYPNPADNALYVVPYYCIEDASFQALRGTFPGAYSCPMTGVNAGGINHRDRVTGVTGLSGRALRAIENIGNDGIFFFDVTGPWR